MPDTPPPSSTAAEFAAAINRYLDQCLAGAACEVALHPDRPTSDIVKRYSIRKVSKRTYRGLLLIACDDTGRFMVNGREGSRQEIAEWLIKSGVPVLLVKDPKRRPH